MKFSEFIVLEKTGGSVDPLGFLRPSTAIADHLFNQFTVLSNHPAYQGFLCFVYAYAARKGIKPGKDFSRTFRDYEILWGVLNSKAGRSILNVTKYNILADQPKLSLETAKAYRDLYLRLNYGTLGHYSSPATLWGLLNSKGTELTPLGAKLGEAWQNRGSLRFEDLLESWVKGEITPEMPDFQKAMDLFNLEAEPSANEISAWQEIISAYSQRHSKIAALWDSPVPSEIMELADNEETYAGFYEGVSAHYLGQPDILRRIGLAREFELLAGCVQFIFEWEYATRSDEGRISTSGMDFLDFRFLQEFLQRIPRYLSIHESKDTFHGMFRNLSMVRSVSALGTEVIRVHAKHQASKGAGAFLRDADILVRDRVDLEKLNDLIQNLSGNPENWEALISWAYRRDWFFGRAAKWLKYAKAAA
ncbi:MAG: hypothetical protein M3Y08_11365 [Fibrobacterota bacterium]|nr:hypothetical protein [Fibrobacterota bacterium]